MGTEYSYISKVYGLDKLLNNIKETYQELHENEDVVKLIKEVELKSNKLGKEGKTVRIIANDSEVCVEFEDRGVIELGLITSKGLLGNVGSKELEFDVYEYNSEVYDY